MDDSAETVLSIYGEAFDLDGLKGLGPGSQGCCGAEQLCSDKAPVHSVGLFTLGRLFSPAWEAQPTSERSAFSDGLPASAV